MLVTQHRTWRRRAVWSAAVAAVVLAAAGSALAASSHPTAAQASHTGLTAQLAKVKAALNKYRDVDVAKADGYAPASPCEQIPKLKLQTSFGGGMGIHYVNNALMKPGPFNVTKPPILVYAPKVGGGLQLVAAEWFKPDADQNVMTDGDRPSLFGRQFDGPMLGHAPGMPIHYDLHVWLWKHNADGMFAEWNPDVTCS
jgi:hypothetical protein